MSADNLPVTENISDGLHAFLRERGAERQDHTGRSLLDHLTGTYELLRRWQQPSQVCWAGLFHSVYGTESFGGAIVARDDRDAVRGLIGVEAEALVYAFCGMRRGEFLEEVAGHAAHTSDPLHVPSRDGWSVAPLSRAQVGGLVITILANHLEQMVTPDGFPQAGLSAASRLLRLSRGYSRSVPGLLGGGARNITLHAERRLMQAYREAWATEQVSSEELLRLTRSSGAIPYLGEPFVRLALEALGRESWLLAGRLVASADELFAIWGISWDRRLTPEEWGELASRVREICAARGARRVQAVRGLRGAWQAAGGEPERLLERLRLAHVGDRFVMAVSRGASPSPGSDTDRARALPPRFRSYVSSFAASSSPRRRVYPGLSSKAWHDARQLDLVRDLERNAAAIKAEFRALEASRFADEAEAIPRSGRWTVLFLHERGREHVANCERCPQTTGVISRHRTMRDGGGLIYFSQLAPKTYVAPHHGPTNMRLRCHLGLEIPDSCGIRVDGKVGGWTEGRCIVIDDSFTHDVWNWSERRRVVLVVDLWHPELSAREVALIRAINLYGSTAGSDARLAR